MYVRKLKVHVLCSNYRKCMLENWKYMCCVLIIGNVCYRNVLCSNYGKCMLENWRYMFCVNDYVMNGMQLSGLRTFHLSMYHVVLLVWTGCFNTSMKCTYDYLLEMDGCIACYQGNNNVPVDERCEQRFHRLLR